MADREESINIKIHLELTEEDRSKLATMAGEVDTAGKKTTATTKREQELDETIGIVESFQVGNVGKVDQFTSKQFGNVKGLASNPSRFIFQAFAGKLAAMARGGLYVALALIIYEIVQWVIDESMQAGRWLDRRFRRVAQEEILGFITRKEQQELRQGFKDIRVTTQQGLRGGQGQVYGNLFAHSEVYGTLANARTGMVARDVIVTSATSHGFATDSNGNPRGGHRTGGGAGK